MFGSLTCVYQQSTDESIGLVARQEHASATTPSTTATATQSGQGQEASSSSSSSSSSKQSGGGHGHGASTFATPYILTTGTFFYIGIAVSFALWCTGFALDFIMDRQEQLAMKMAISKKHCVDSPTFPATLKA